MCQTKLAHGANRATWTANPSCTGTFATSTSGRAQAGLVGYESATVHSDGASRPYRAPSSARAPWTTKSRLTEWRCGGASDCACAAEVETELAVNHTCRRLTCVTNRTAIAACSAWLATIEHSVDQTVTSAAGASRVVIESATCECHRPRVVNRTPPTA